MEMQHGINTARLSMNPAYDSPMLSLYKTLQERVAEESSIHRFDFPHNLLHFPGLLGDETIAPIRTARRTGSARMSLPVVPDITALSRSVIRILGQNGPSKFVLQGTNTYLIGTGRQRILLDTGEGRDAYNPLLESVLKEQDCTITKVLLSHWHHDHVEGLPAVRNVISRSKHTQGPPQIWKFQHESDEADWLVVNDGDEIQVEGATLRAIHTPGHTTDHLAFHLLQENVLFTADHILGGSTSVFEDLSAYMASLRKLEKLKIQTLYPGHGLEMRNGVEIITEYIRHRQLREDQIVKVLQEAKTSTAMGIVKVVYKDVREDLHIAAEHGVRQHLEKLEKEGRAIQVDDDDDDEHWKLTNQARI